MRFLLIALIGGSFGAGVSALANAGEEEFRFFNSEHAGGPKQDVPLIQPWRVVRLEPDYGGQWAVAGDLDGDGQPEIISAENFNQDDTHYTSAVAAQKLDGSVLWTWGDPDIGRKSWHHDVACQVYDWDGDGRNEVIVADKTAIVELDGATGEERRRIPIEEGASDCVVFCNLSGGPRPTDVLVKDRYHRIWAYTRAGELLWSVEDPAGGLTTHQPRPMDIDGDGRDEIMAGYAMLNADGTVRWVYKSEKVELGRGHLDCARVFQQADNPGDFRIVATCCGANNIVMLDGTGKVVWELPGRHFESIQVGHVIPGHPGPHILVDIDHQPYGHSPIWLFGGEGELLGRLNTDYSRHHRLLDWTGDGFDEVVVGGSQGLYGADGACLGTFAMPGLIEEQGGYEVSILDADMTGDGVPDILIITPHLAYIYKNENGRRPENGFPLGTGFNVTLY